MSKPDPDTASNDDDECVCPSRMSDDEPSPVRNLSPINHHNVGFPEASSAEIKIKGKERGRLDGVFSAAFGDEIVGTGMITS